MKITTSNREITITRKRPRCFYCGTTWGVIRWTTVLPSPWASSRWVCLWHTRRHWKESA